MISESHLIYIYQHQHLFDQVVVSYVKEEAFNRNLINSAFEAIL